jgi:hypothetical protein
MTPYEYIKSVIEHGQWIAVKKNDGNYKVFTYVRPNGNIEGTVIRGTVEGCLTYGLSGGVFSEEEMTTIKNANQEVYLRVFE